MEYWYVLYSGQSEDGRGKPVYEGRTTDPRKALAHYRHHIKPLGSYATGRVDRISDNTVQFGMTEDELRNDATAKRAQEDVASLKAEQIKTMMTTKRTVIPVEPESEPTPKPDNWGGFA